jgi:dihydroorotate dehydrogenase
VPVGANVGKSKVTPLEEAAGDYALSVRRLAGLADWFTVNVSSPNTPGLRSLQDPQQLAAILGAVQKEAKGTPVLLKLAPDLDADALGAAVEIAVENGLAGIIATNTTLSRQGLKADPHEAGGLSGRPLWPIARVAIGHVLAASAGRLPVIGCGGVSSADQARELLTAGCAAVQLYSALVLEGPGLPARVNRALSRS